MRENAPYESAYFKLRGLNPDKNYEFTDFDGETFIVPGKILTEDGLLLSVHKKRTAKIYIYKEI